MKTIQTLGVAVGVFLLGACGAAGGDTGGADGTFGQLSSRERATLEHMREEEKLARDVYSTVPDAAPFLDNIVASEQRHMAATLGLLERYAVPDPADGKPVGAFTSESLQALHDRLVARAAGSRVEALRVGAEIEELDLVDLDQAIAETDHDDVRAVYENLARGSRNHLRHFDAALGREGVPYTPQHLDAGTYAAIVGSPMERGPGGRGRR